MNSFKTPKGTILPLLNLRGKLYLQVAQRLVWFREDNPSWLITTSFLRMEEDSTIAKAEIFDEIGKLRAVGHKREDRKDFSDHLEKAESSAVGRALAMIGYGTQFTAEELNEGERLADAPIDRSNPYAITPPGPQDGNTDPTHYKISFGKFAQKTLEQVGPDELRGYVGYLEKMAAKDKKEITGKVKEFIELASDYIASFENAEPEFPGTK